MKRLAVRISILFVLIVTIATSCKKDETTEKSIYKSGGFIKGTITGLSADSIALNETFIFDRYKTEFDATYTTHEVANKKYYDFTITRFNPDNENNNISLSFSLESLTNQTPISDYQSAQISYIKVLEKNGLLVLSANIENSSIDTPVIINYLTFDAQTGKMKGNYKFTIEHSPTRKTQIVGEFELTVRQLFNK